MNKKLKIIFFLLTIFILSMAFLVLNKDKVNKDMISLVSAWVPPDYCADSDPPTAFQGYDYYNSWVKGTAKIFHWSNNQYNVEERRTDLCPPPANVGVYGDNSTTDRFLWEYFCAIGYDIPIIAGGYTDCNNLGADCVDGRCVASD